MKDETAKRLLSTILWVANPFTPVVDVQCTHCGRLAEAKAPVEYASSYVECSTNCGAKYCGEVCRNAGEGHVCVGPHSVDHPIYLLKMLALEAGPTIYATIHLALALICSLGIDKAEALLSGAAKVLSVERAALGKALAAHVDTSYKLVLEVLGDTTEKPVVLLKEKWSNMLQLVSAQIVEGSTKSMYASECERVSVVEGWNDSCNGYLLDLLEGEATAVEIMDEPGQYFPPTLWFALFQESLRHSCCPSHALSGDAVGRIHLRARFEGKNDGTGGEATISIIDSNHELEIRTEMMEEKGLLNCQCLRCTFEREPLNTNSFLADDLRLLLEHAKDQMRYDDAMDIAEAMVRSSPKDGAALFSRARIAGWKGDFQKREQLLNEAVILVEDTATLAELKEADAYYRKQDGGIIHQPSTPWITVDGLEECVYVGEKILDADECLNMVNVAEAYQLERGNWTTSRHYAVPTTDVPIHEIPELLSWFNLQLEQMIFPAMEEHFETVGRLRIFDAFLVKYDADTGQKRLPLHNDQSEFSLTIAMNGINCYEGGGTYFNDVGETVKTDVGGIISFKGELLHAGQMITYGQRYVIVCFIYEEDEI
jgi:tetratricopeptide (TPR) repeat protein